jgi:hypothetical protein
VNGNTLSNNNLNINEGGEITFRGARERVEGTVQAADSTAYSHRIIVDDSDVGEEMGQSSRSNLKVYGQINFDDHVILSKNGDGELRFPFPNGGDFDGFDRRIAINPSSGYLQIYGHVEFMSDVSFMAGMNGGRRALGEDDMGEKKTVTDACTCADVEDKIKAANDETKQQVEMLQTANAALEARLARLEAMLLSGTGTQGQTIQDQEQDGN